MSKLALVLQLGDPRLYEVCTSVVPEERAELAPAVQTLHDILMEFQALYGIGRAIAAPQIGVMKRLVYLHIDRPVVLYNPVLSDCSEELFELWDDCLSFPNLLVKLMRHRRCTLTFRDADWQLQQWQLEDDLSELLQHECDHLDGILATQRAAGVQDFKWRDLEGLRRQV